MIEVWAQYKRNGMYPATYIATEVHYFKKIHLGDLIEFCKKNYPNGYRIILL